MAESPSPSPEQAAAIGRALAEFRWPNGNSLNFGGPHADEVARHIAAALAVAGSPQDKPTGAAREFAEAVIRNDQTPPFAYSEARLSDGEKPPAGERWATPAELARDFLRLIAAHSEAGGVPTDTQDPPQDRKDVEAHLRNLAFEIEESDGETMMVVQVDNAISVAGAALPDSPQDDGLREALGIIERQHQAYPGAVDGGYQGMCHDCDWEGALFPRTTSPDRGLKDRARREAMEHSRAAGLVIEATKPVALAAAVSSTPGDWGRR